jgi:RNA polymerase-binding transcription factor DksA
VPDDHRAVLLGEQARLAAQVADLAREFDGIVESAASAPLDDEHDPDGATVGFERARVAALLAQARANLAELDDALARLAEGTYGVCASCGRPIPPERLAARPATTVCVACAAGPGLGPGAGPLTRP